MLDYLKWRGDLPLDSVPMNELDMLVFSQLAYLHFRDALGGDTSTLHDAIARVEAIPREGGNAQIVALRHTLGLRVAASARFGGLLVSRCEDIFDEAREMQFAAITLTLPGNAHVVAYRGTDATIVGWREDLNMSHACPVPSQVQAEQYLLGVAAQKQGVLNLCGHSKGGNLALYASARCGAAVRARTKGVYVFDAPGFPDRLADTEGYRASLPAVHCYVPQTSMVGQLMRVPQTYTVVRSTATGMSQHNVFTWALDGPHFATLPALDSASRLIKETLDTFLVQSTPEMRRQFVDTLFDVLGATGAHTFGQMAGRWTGTAGAVIGAARTLDPVTRRAVFSVMGSLASSGVESAMRWITEEREAGEIKPQPEG